MFDLIEELHKPLPRYTSYPTAVDWISLTEKEYQQKLAQCTDPLSLYIHIPFCEKMCLFCGCSVILNRKEEHEIAYVESLVQEIKLVSQILPKKMKVTQLHFGGGTPTKLSRQLLQKIMETLESEFILDKKGEIAIEVDPRTVSKDQGEKMIFLKKLGFNRISFGVQDSNEKVQEAVKRRQSWQMTKETFFLAKEIGFHKINIDLIYGLPLQTKESFQQTIKDILSLQPDRIALFSYAKIPWLKPHQKAIKEEQLPRLEEKFALYADARNTLIERGYQAIGMDHFAREHDELSKAYHQKRLTRNFQGYSVTSAKEMIGFGLTSIGFVQGGYFQNSKNIQTYHESLDLGKLPIERGLILSEDDLIRKEIIHTLMCHFELQKRPEFVPYLSSLSKELQVLEEKKLIQNLPNKLFVTPLGELFIRNIATLFDRYRTNPSTHFSKSI